jgi:hypothetical protein
VIFLIIDIPREEKGTTVAVPRVSGWSINADFDIANLFQPIIPIVGQGFYPFFLLENVLGFARVERLKHLNPLDYFRIV